MDWRPSLRAWGCRDWAAAALCVFLGSIAVVVFHVALAMGAFLAIFIVPLAVFLSCAVVVRDAPTGRVERRDRMWLQNGLEHLSMGR